MKYLSFLFFLIFGITLSAQEGVQYSRVKILLNSENDIHQLNKLGVISEGTHAKGRFFTSDFSEKEIRIIEEAGYTFEIEIEDVQGFYVKQNSETREGQVDCPEIPSTGIQIPENFEYGSMGGYLTHDEIMSELDKMKALYPNLISTKAPISTTILTHEGRTVQWVRISDNPEMDEIDEPEIMYNSLLHAREPAGMMQMIFYMWYVLENYETDEEIKYLVDNLEMYFIPCVNPDGYIYNESTDSNGGGLWRKNRRNNGDGSFGVDLNRNFGYTWAYDDDGSSNNPSSNAYRGPSEFSEPETQLLKEFIENHDFNIVLNYHAYGNLFLRPWGHIDDLPDDIDIFDAFGELMVEENGFAYGGADVIGYFANGDADGYMYGAEQIISYTPEVGSSFWPAISDINNNAIDNLLPNLYAARFLLNYGRATEDNNETTISSLTGDFNFNLKKYGYKDGDLIISLSSDEIVTVSAPITTTLNHLEEQNLLFNYELNSGLVADDEMIFTLNIDNGEHVFKQTFTKTFGGEDPEIPLVFDEGNNMDNWNNSTFWGITNARYFSAPTSIADSPQGDYQAGNTSLLSLGATLDLTNATEAYVTFRAEWAIEASYDYCQLQASNELAVYQALCGVYTQSGSSNQDTGEPVWDGTKTGWVTEKLLLNDYLGESAVNLRFRLVSDNFVQGDGFFFDDFAIVVVGGGITNTYEFTAEDFVIQTFPNPVAEQLNIELSDIPEKGRIVFYNSLGQELMGEKINSKKIEFNLKHFSKGIYYYSIFSNNELLDSRKLIIN